MPGPTVNTTVSALRFFCRVTLDRPEVARHLAVVPKAHGLPVVLSLDEVARFLEATSEPKYKAAFSLAYGAGLRVAEIAALKVSDINSKRMLVRVEQGKRRKRPTRRSGSSTASPPAFATGATPPMCCMTVFRRGIRALLYSAC